MRPVQLDMLEWLEASALPSLTPSIEPIVMQRIDPAKNMRRFYALSIERTLFADYALIRRYGRIGSRQGQMRSEAFVSMEAAETALHKLAEVKRRRGYG
jgi:predicted DNA-binding WGR domain protein